VENSFDEVDQPNHVTKTKPIREWTPRLEMVRHPVWTLQLPEMSDAPLKVQSIDIPVKVERSSASK
jgi:hypothetical protein